MKKISSKNNSLYRIELVSENKLQKIFTICHNAQIPYPILPVWFPIPLPPFPCPPLRHGGAEIEFPQKKIPYLLLKHKKNC